MCQDIGTLETHTHVLCLSHTHKHSYSHITHTHTCTVSLSLSHTHTHTHTHTHNRLRRLTVHTYKGNTNVICLLSSRTLLFILRHQDSRSPSPRASVAACLRVPVE